MEQLLQFLAQALQQDQEDYRTCGWLLQRVPGGMNGITYRATHDLDFPQPITLKIRKRDERNRAWREFSALEVLSAQDKPIVPKPIALFSKVDSLPGDVVISNWVEGQVLKNLDDASLPLWDMETPFSFALPFESCEHLIGRQLRIGDQRIATISALCDLDGFLIALKAQAQSPITPFQFVLEQASCIAVDSKQALDALLHVAALAIAPRVEFARNLAQAFLHRL